MKYISLCAAMMLSCTSFAQNNQQFCGTKYQTNWETPAFNLARLPENFAAKSTATYSIPVVFHVVHDAGSENLSTTAVNNALSTMNKRFANEVPHYNVNGVNVDISFCLATQDPDGNPTTGIIYHADEATDYGTYRADNGLPPSYRMDSLIKSQYHWPTDKYLNIYTVKEMEMGMNATATFPDMHGNFMDGIMSISSFVMTDGLCHEAGHYFGLYHTFSSTCDNDDCLNDNDKVCDTPPDMVAEWVPQNCEVNTCTSDEDDASINNPFRSTVLGGLGDQQDDTRNYMDFSACNVKKHTQGQKERMQAALTTIRGSLLTSPGCQAPTSTTSVARSNIYIYPNPATDRINIDGADKSVATLYNTIGQQIIKVNITSDKHVMNTTALQSGIFTLMVVNKDGSKTVTRITKP